MTLATAAGTVTTAFDGTLSTAASLTVLGTITARSDATGRAVGGAILGAFSKPTVHATTNPTVNTRLGGTVTASGAIVAKSDVTTAANAIGSVFTRLADRGASPASTSPPPTARRCARASPRARPLHGGSITIGALHNFPYPTSATDLTRGAHASARRRGRRDDLGRRHDVNAIADANVDTTVAATATLRALAPRSGRDDRDRRAVGQHRRRPHQEPVGRRDQRQHHQPDRDGDRRPDDA